MFVDKKEVGERILKIRKEYGYSMERFGEIIDNAPKGSVNSWEKGVNLPNEKRLEQIATLGNVTLNELLYGSFKKYADKLITDKLGIELPEKMSEVLYQQMQKNGYSYGDDIEIIRLVNGFLTYHNLTTKETAIFYQPSAYTGTYYDGIVQKADYSVHVCTAFSDKDANTLHILPSFDEEKKEENIQFYDKIEELSIPHKHNYFTSGFLTLGLALRDSKLIYYSIDDTMGCVQIKTFEFDCEKDAYMANDKLDYNVNPRFNRDADKEAMYRKFQSEQKK